MLRVRAAALLALAALGTACSATRAYEGPALPREQIATIQEYPSGMGGFFGALGTELALGTVWHSELTGVDDGEDISVFDDGGAEVLPGRHAVRVVLISQSMAGTTRHPECLALFDAQAGHTYELRGHGATLAEPAGFDVWDVEGGGPVASSHASADECVTARLDWGGSHWTQADWQRSSVLTTTSYVPSGDVLSSWRQIVELQHLRSREVPDLDEVMAIKLEDLEDSGDEAFQTLLESADGLRVFTWSVIEDGAGPQQGLTCLRSDAKGCHIMVFAVRGVLSPHDSATWAARFKTAELVPPPW